MDAAPGGEAPAREPPRAPAPPCACSNISIMQLFHELKQQFPAVPDHIVSTTISAHCHDRDACRTKLETEQRRLLAAVHPARSRHDPHPRPVHPVEPTRCPNRSDTPPPLPPSQSNTNDSRSEIPVDKPQVVVAAARRPDSLPLLLPRNDIGNNSGFPLNVSVNLNCRMDILSEGAPDSSRSDFGSPGGSYASVNLTVCTPTEGRYAEPARQKSFEGRVHITLNPAQQTSPQQQHSGYRDGRTADRARSNAVDVPQERSQLSPIESLLRRQRLQFDKLKEVIRSDYARIATIRREIRILQTPAPVSNVVQHREVQKLRDSCQILYRQMEETPNAGRLLQGDEDVNDNPNPRQCRPIVGAQSQADESESSWQCHVCTFLNHALLNKCEECDMPRIILVHSDDEITVQLHPGCNKITRSWIL